MPQPPKDAIISYFRSIYHSEPAIKSTGDEMTLLRFLDLVKRGHYSDQIKTIYAEPDKEKRSRLKKDLPAVTISGKFSRSANDALIQHSGFICIDFDNIQDMGKALDGLQADIYTYAVFKSASGLGLAVVVKIDTDPEKHKGAFRRLSDYYHETYGLMADAQCSDLKRFRFMSADPDLYHNPDAKKWTKTAIKVLEREEEKRNLDTVVAPSDLKRIVEQIEARGIDITNGYMHWRNVGFALSWLGEEGRDIFHRVSQQNAAYDREQCDKQFNACLDGRGQTKIRIGTFYYYCQQEGISLRSETTRRAIEIAAMKKGQEANFQDTTDTVAKQLELPKEEAESIVTQVWQQQNAQSGLNVPARIRLHIDTEYVRRFNELENKMYINGSPFSKDNEPMFIQGVREAIGQKAAHADIKNCFKNQHNVERYHPIKEWFAKHGNRKPMGVIDTVADMIPSSTVIADMTARDFTRKYLRKYLIGVMANIYEKYDKSELELIIIGKQGTGKSRFFKYLLPDELREYYEDDTLDAANERDNYFTLARNIIIVDNEGNSQNHSKIERSKRIMGLRNKMIRQLATDSDMVKLNLIASLAVTSNNLDMLKDSTGNRRKIPLYIGNNKINIDEFRAVDKTDLLIEAWLAYRCGEPYYLTDNEVDLFSESFDQFRDIDPVYEAILHLFKPAEEDKGTKVAFTRIVEQVKAYNQWLTQTQINRIQYVLSTHFKKCRFSGGARGYWVAYTEDYHEIKREQDQR